ncbi:hypothetical protein [Sphingomonas sp. VDB2]|uniref:hypothetical protein n=1 Tax=Sphingomonas sp. VDB2 TaxID=3228751 RepID=UPI003A80CEC0
MTDAKKKDAFIIRDFKDSGTETSFAGGSVVAIEEGAFANYEAAGLVRKATAEDRKDASKASGASGAAA